MENDLEPLQLFLTIKETAELLRVNPRTVKRLVERNKLPAFKAGSRWRVRKSELAKYLQSLNEL